MAPRAPLSKTLLNRRKKGARIVSPQAARARVRRLSPVLYFVFLPCFCVHPCRRTPPSSRGYTLQSSAAGNLVRLYFTMARGRILRKRLTRGTSEGKDRNSAQHYTAYTVYTARQGGIRLAASRLIYFRRSLIKRHRPL